MAKCALFSGQLFLLSADFQYALSVNIYSIFSMSVRIRRLDAADSATIGVTGGSGFEKESDRPSRSHPADEVYN